MNMTDREFRELLFRRNHEAQIQVVDRIRDEAVAAGVPCYPSEVGYHYNHWDDAGADDPWEGPMGMTYQFYCQPNLFYACCGFTFYVKSSDPYHMRKDVITLQFYENPDVFHRINLLPKYIPNKWRHYEVTFDAPTQTMLNCWEFRCDSHQSWQRIFTISPDLENPAIGPILEMIGRLRSLRGQIVFQPSLFPPKKPRPSTSPDAIRANAPAVRLLPEPEPIPLLRELEKLDTSHQRRRAIGERLAEIGDPRPGIGLRPDGIPQIEWCYVAGGEVEVGGWHFLVRPFFISKYLITYSQFQAFLEAPDGFAAQEKRLQEYRTPKEKKPEKPKPPFGYVASPWNTEQERVQMKIEREREEDHAFVRALIVTTQAICCEKIKEQNRPLANYPRVDINWHQMEAFARWLTSKLRPLGWPKLPEGEQTCVIRGKKRTPALTIHLPTEWEWLLAATGGDLTNVYPWGAELDTRRLNSSEAGIGETTAVGMYPAGAARCGALDMAGNVAEWCINDITPNKSMDSLNSQPRALRGGSWHDDEQQARCASGGGLTESFVRPYVGFRVALSDIGFHERTRGK